MSVADASLFTLTRDGRQAFLLIYVDDGLIVGTQKDVENIIKVLEVFELRKLGPAAYFLGMEIVRDREARTLLLSQQKYTEQILQEAGMQDCKPRSIPMEVNTRLSKEGIDYMEDKAAYCNKLGQVLYLCSGTRPDIAYAVGVLARFAASPREEHWRKLKGVLQYLRHTAHRGLMFGGDTELKLEGYSDGLRSRSRQAAQHRGLRVHAGAWRDQLGVKAACNCGGRMGSEGGAMAAQAADYTAGGRRRNGGGDALRQPRCIGADAQPMQSSARKAH